MTEVITISSADERKIRPCETCIAYGGLHLYITNPKKLKPRCNLGKFLIRDGSCYRVDQPCDSHFTAEEMVQIIQQQNAEVVIGCPICGRTHNVPLVDYAIHELMNGHPYTCGNDSCPSHTEMILIPDENELLHWNQKKVREIRLTFDHWSHGGPGLRANYDDIPGLSDLNFHSGCSYHGTMDFPDDTLEGFKKAAEKGLNAIFTVCLDREEWKNQEKICQDEFKQALIWLGTDDTGISSKTLLYTAINIESDDLNPARGTNPWDPADLGRCIRLIEKYPWVREKAFPLLLLRGNYAWKQLIHRWDELERLYYSELPSGRAPKTYELMQKLIYKEKE